MSVFCKNRKWINGSCEVQVDTLPSCYQGRVVSALKNESEVEWREEKGTESERVHGDLTPLYSFLHHEEKEWEDVDDEICTALYSVLTL